MKIKHLPIVIAALTLCACGGANQNQNQNQNSGESTTDANPNDSLAEYVAYQAYKLICPDSTAYLPDSIENNLKYQVVSMPDPETDCIETVLCFPKKSGGYVAVYNVQECMAVGDWGGCDYLTFKAYDYSDGRVKEDNSLLPKPSFDDFNKHEALWFYNPKDKNLDSAKAAFAKNGFKYMTYGDTTIAAFVIGYGDAYLRIFYEFDGEVFVPIKDNKYYPLITEHGLGGIRIGEVPPQTLPGFDVNTMGRTIYYNRNAKKEFKISLAADGTTDTITIYSPKYAYRFWGGGYGYLYVGSDAMGDEYEHLFSDSDMYNASVDQDNYYLNPEGGVINFYVPGDKAIEYIKIYKHAEANTSDYDENNSNSDLPQTATGDLNGDGIKDSVAFNKGFFVYFGGADGKYNLFKTYKVLDLESNDYITFKTSAKIDDGKLIISTRKNGDGWDNIDYTLKFQDGDFVLLKLYEDGGLDGSSDITYDFEAKTYKGDFDECEGDSYTTTAKLKNLPSPKLSDIVIGDPAYNFVDGYIDESTEKTKTY